MSCTYCLCDVHHMIAAWMGFIVLKYKPNFRYTFKLICMYLYIHYAERQTLQDLVNQYPDKVGLCIATSCTKPHNGSPESEIRESESVDCMRKCMEDDLGYLFAEVTTSDITQWELKSFLNGVKSITFPDSYRWIFFYYFGHGNKESIHLSDRDMKRIKIIEGLKSIHRRELTKIVWFECCRLVDCDQSPTLTVCEDLDNFLIINATSFNRQAFYIDHDSKQNQKSCGILTKYFTETVTKLNAPICAVMGKVNEAIFKKYKRDEVHISECEDHIIGVINFLADSTGSCKCTVFGVGV